MTATTSPVVPKSLFRDGFLEDPYPVYREFQAAGSIHVVDWNGRAVWTVFTHADCLTVLKDPRISARRTGVFLAAFPKEMQEQYSELIRVLGLWLLFMDAPEHSRLRKLMNKGFSAASLEILRPQIESVVDQMLERMRNKSEADLMTEIAHPLPVSVISQLLGVPAAMERHLSGWSDAIAAFFGNPRRTPEQVQAAHEAVQELMGYFRGVVAERRLNKGGDLISLLLDIEADGDVLSEEELLAQCVMLLFGGHETTRNLIGNGMYCLLRHPDQKALLQDNPTLIRSAIEELLRFESPVQYMNRIVRQEVQICDVSFRPGDPVVAVLGAANRDPQQFSDPDILNVARTNNAHLAFGGGPHFCIGSQLARLEGQVAIQRMLQRFPNMHFAPQPPQRAINFVLRSFASLPVACA